MPRSSRQEWSEFLKEYKSTEVMNKAKTQSCRKLKFENQARTSDPKDRRQRNSGGKLFRLMKEEKSTGVTSNGQMNMGEELKSYSPIRTSNAKDSHMN
jgi:hypothetical protein